MGPRSFKNTHGRVVSVARRGPSPTVGVSYTTHTQEAKKRERKRIALVGEFVAIIFSTNDSIFGGVMSKINRDKWLEIWEPERYVMSRRDKWLEIWGSKRYVPRH